MNYKYSVSKRETLIHCFIGFVLSQSFALFFPLYSEAPHAFADRVLSSAILAETASLERERRSIIASHNVPV